MNTTNATAHAIANALVRQFADRGFTDTLKRSANVTDSEILAFGLIWGREIATGQWNEASAGRRREFISLCHNSGIDRREMAEALAAANEEGLNR